MYQKASEKPEGLSNPKPTGNQLLKCWPPPVSAHRNKDSLKSMEHHSLTAAWALPPHYHHQKEYCPIHCDVKSYYLSCYKSNCSFAPVELCCFDIGINSVQSLSCVRLFATPWTAAHQGSLSITNSWSLLKLMSIELVMPSNHLSLCRPLPLLPSIFPSIRIFSNESVLHIKWPNYWSFSISCSNEYLELISFRIDWFDLLAV